jgi:hypothetical protein
MSNLTSGSAIWPQQLVARFLKTTRTTKVEKLVYDRLAFYSMRSLDEKSDLRFRLLSPNNVQQSFIKTSKSLIIEKLVYDWSLSSQWKGQIRNPTSDSDFWFLITYSKVRSKLRKALKHKSSFLIGQPSSKWEGWIGNLTSYSDSWPLITYSKVQSKRRKGLK